MLRSPIHALLLWAGRKMEQADHFRRSHTMDHLKRQFQSLGTNVEIKSTTRIIDPRSVAVGHNVHIGDDCYFFAEGGLQIGDNVHISRRVTIYCSDHDYRSGILPYGPERRWSQVVIERNVWIGMNVCILPGVRIGEGAIIGMGAVVAKDVPPRAIVGQQPYRVLGERKQDEYEKAKTKENFGGASGFPIAADDLSRIRARSEPPGRIAFVVTTGRSGSSAIADTLRQHPNIDARHEPRPQLIQWSTQYAHREISEAEARRKLQELFLETSTFDSRLLRVESDQKYFNFISLLSEIFPDSRFIWLTRSPESVVASTVGRGWYANEAHPNFLKVPWFYHRNRLNGALTNDVTERQWESMPVFERNCWYWSYVNRTISEQLDKLSPRRWRKVSIERIAGQLDEVLTFLDVPLVKILPRRTNDATYSQKGPDHWTPEERMAFARWCSPNPF